MGGLFSKPKAPELPPPTPVVDQAAATEMGNAADIERMRQRKAAGRASTMLTSRLGQQDSANIGTKVLGG